MFPFYRVPELHETLPLDPPEPECDFAPGDDVLVNGKNGVQYDGFVKQVDAWQGLVLVQIWDHQIGGKHVGWWEEKYLAPKTKTTAEAVA